MYISIISKLFAGFIGAIIVMRTIGKKSLSDLTPFDIIYSIVLGGVIQEGLYDENIHIGHILFALLVWGIVIYIVETFLQRRDSVTRKIKGHPSVLIYKGEINIHGIKKNYIEMEQLRTILRENGCFSLSSVDYAVMETNGKVTLMTNENKSSPFTYLIVDEGTPEEKTLDTLQKDKKWLYDELSKERQLNIEDIIYAEWSEEAGLYIKTYDDCFDENIIIDG